MMLYAIVVLVITNLKIDSASVAEPAETKTSRTIAGRQSRDDIEAQDAANRLRLLAEERRRKATEARENAQVKNQDVESKKREAASKKAAAERSRAQAEALERLLERLRLKADAYSPVDEVLRAHISVLLDQWRESEGMAKALEKEAGEAESAVKTAEVAAEFAEAEADRADRLATEAEREVRLACVVTPEVTGVAARLERRACRTERRVVRHALREERRIAIEEALPKEGLIRRLAPMRDARCATAFCFGPLNKWAIEPMADLPAGGTFAVPSSSLAKFVNGNDLGLTFTAGLRFWLWWDWVSVDIHLSKPIYPMDKTIHVDGSDFEYSVKNVRRVLPGIGIGLAHDFLWFGMDYDQLRNSTDASDADRSFQRGDVVAGAFVFTIGIAPIAAARNMFGAIKGAKEAKAEARTKAKAEADNKAAAEMKNGTEPGDDASETALPSTTSTSANAKDAEQPSQQESHGTNLARDEPPAPRSRDPSASAVENR